MKLPNLKSLCAGTIAVLASISSSSGEIVVAWETTGQTAWGTQGLPSTSPSYNDPSVTTVGLTRGAGVETVNSAAANGWGGHGWDGAAVPGEPNTFEEALAAEQFITFSVTPNTDFEFSATTLDLNYRRSETGPSSATLQYQINAGAFVNLDTLTFGSVSTAGSSITDVDLSTIPTIAEGQTLTFRLVPFGATASGGTFYIYGPVEGFDLSINGSVDPEGGGGGPDTKAPLVAGLTPPDNAIGVSVTGSTTLRMIFNENVTSGTGLIYVKKVSDNSIVNTIDVENLDQISVLNNRVGLILSTPLAPATAYYVEIPSGAILDLASPANSFLGYAGNAAWNFTTSSAAANPTVVVNKFLNGPPDRIELLVIGNGSVGSTVDMRGMIIKDFSSSNTGDGGGKFTFTQDSLWSAVPAGTLVVLSSSGTSPDVSATDFKLSVGLTDVTYFTSRGGAFDISTTDMVAILAARVDPTSVLDGTGGIHALASGAQGSQFTSFPGAKIFATGTTGTNLGAIANNATSSIIDYNPTTATGATGGVSLSLSNFGAANNGANAAYIAALRGLPPGNGDGTATFTNVSAGSPLLGSGIFDDGVSGQSARITVNALIPSVTLNNVTVIVPSGLGTPSSATLSGPGASGASVMVSGQTVTVASASATVANALLVTINGLTTPTSTSVTDTGNFPFSVSTSATGGTLTPISIAPVARVIIPITNLRDVDANGVALDSGIIVAVEGVATEENFGVANTQAFIQDSAAGINLFSASPTIIPITRGNRYAAIGSLIQFNGLSEISLAAATDVVNLGAGTPPTPQIVTIAQLLANAEALEGSLITVQNLTYVSGSWAANTTTVLKDSTPTNIDIRVPQGSTATVVPSSYPVSVTGILTQFDASSPFTGTYQLSPRDPADVVAFVPPTNTYASWIGGFNVGTQTAKTDDFDNDGLDNAVENYLGTNPSVFSPGPTLVSATPSAVTFRLTRSDTVATDLVPSYEWSTNLTTWTASGPGPGGLTVTIVTSVVTNGSPNDVIEVVSTVSGGTATKLFVRLKVL